jgi:hypothetical protein
MTPHYPVAPPNFVEELSVHVDLSMIMRVFAPSNECIQILETLLQLKAGLPDELFIRRMLLKRNSCNASSKRVMSELKVGRENKIPLALQQRTVGRAVHSHLASLTSWNLQRLVTRGGY